MLSFYLGGYSILYLPEQVNIVLSPAIYILICSSLFGYYAHELKCYYCMYPQLILRGERGNDISQFNIQM